MNRNEEYAALAAALETTPPELEYTVQRALARKKASQRKRRLFGVPAGSLAVCFTAFVLLVNLFPPFAVACGNVPLLRELAKAVAWSPSLSAAVENEYVQPIEQTQTVNGVTASVHYVIVDGRSASIFYSLDTKEDLALAVDSGVLAADGTWLESSFISHGGPLVEKGELRELRLEFTDSDMPGAVTLTLKVYAQAGDWEMAPASTEDSYFEEPVREERDYLAEFTFLLEFDPYFTSQREVLPIHKTFQLDGQTFTLTEAELYPTQMRIRLVDAPENTAWLKGVDLYLENERGERFEGGGSGISASGDPDGEGYGTFWLDSPFFSRSEHLTLHITRAEWKDKEAPPVRLDLENGTAEHLPDFARFLGARRLGGGWVVSFALPYKGERGMYSLFSGGFRDGEGREYEVNQNSSTIGYEDPETGETVAEDILFTEEFPLVDFTGHVVFLEPRFNRVTDHAPAVTVPIK